jgi:hypothetical protein
MRASRPLSMKDLLKLTQLFIKKYDFEEYNKLGI